MGRAACWARRAQARQRVRVRTGLWDGTGPGSVQPDLMCTAPGSKLPVADWVLLPMLRLVL